MKKYLSLLVCVMLLLTEDLSLEAGYIDGKKIV